MNKDKEIQNNLPENFVKGGKSINLIPALTKEEKIVVSTKRKVNVSAAISLLILFSFTLLIVGFNVFAKMSLNNTKKSLYTIETQIKNNIGTLKANNEILKRALLYQDIEKNTYSTKSVIVYMQNVSNGFSTLDTIELTDGVNFIISGSSPNLTDVSKLWYILANDKYIKNVNLKSVTKGNNIATFTFEGQLNVETFINSQKTDGEEG